MIEKVISGGQSGADVAALRATKKCGIPTGGTMPKGWLTELGPMPEWAEEFNLVEHKSNKYQPRTFQNVKDSDGTLRFAGKFNSAGERCTLKAITQYNKPYFDIDIYDPPTKGEVVQWIKDNNIEIINVAGNRESTVPGIEAFVEEYMTKLLSQSE